jgi:hypothetical protein
MAALRDQVTNQHPGRHAVDTAQLLVAPSQGDYGDGLVIEEMKNNPKQKISIITKSSP